MIVDANTWIWDSPRQLGPAASEMIRRRNRTPGLRILATPDVHQQAMLDGQVNVAMVHGLVSQTLQTNITPADVARYVAMQSHCCLGLAPVDPTRDDYLRRLEEAHQLGLSGICISPAAQKCYPGHDHVLRLADECDKRGWPLWIHTASQWASSVKLEYAQPMLLDELARSFPSLVIVISELGEPFLDQTLAMLVKHPNMLTDLAQQTSQPWRLYHALRSASERQVIDRLLPASGFPFCQPLRAWTAIAQINRITQGASLPRIPQQELDDLLRRNVLKLLKVNAPISATTPEPIP